MQVRFLQDGDLKCTDGSIIHVGCNEIHPCERVTYDDHSRQFATIHFQRDKIVNDVNGEVFEPVGYDVYFANKEIASERQSDSHSTGVGNISAPIEEPREHELLEMASSPELPEVSGEGTAYSGDSLSPPV